MSLFSKIFGSDKPTYEGVLQSALKNCGVGMEVCFNSAKVKVLSLRREEGKDCSKFDYHKALVERGVGGTPDSPMQWKIDSKGVLYYKGIRKNHIEDLGDGPYDFDYWFSYEQEAETLKAGKKGALESDVGYDLSKFDVDERTVQELLKLNEEKFLASQMVEESTLILKEMFVTQQSDIWVKYNVLGTEINCKTNPLWWDVCYEMEKHINDLSQKHMRTFYDEMINKWIPWLNEKKTSSI